MYLFCSAWGDLTITIVQKGIDPSLLIKKESEASIHPSIPTQAQSKHSSSKN